MKELFSHKIQSIHDGLIQCYKETRHYSPTITGSEREIFQKELLEKILPNNYRIGAGSICDSYGAESGQVDLVIELPFSLSFPVSSGQNRLYLADSVGAAFEIKSNLNSQWDEAIEKVIEIKSLNRFRNDEGEIVLLDALKIPTFIVAYKGYTSINTIYKKLEAVNFRERSDGIFIIESGIFMGRSNSNNLIESKTPKGSTLAFISCIYQYLQTYSKNITDLNSYIKLLNASSIK
jgi:hypothetical protein